MGMNGNRKLLILKGWNGGRAGTRTPDLLRVKPDVGFSWLHDFHCVLCLFNRLGSLLFAQSASSIASTDGVLIRL
jgi:hypothetical protein